MKRAVLIVLLALLPGMVFAETVMLFARIQPGSSHKQATLDRFTAVEDGVEDQFFTDGHIIFDSGAPVASETVAAHSDQWAKRIAAKGGADFLLIVNLGFPNGKTRSPLPSTASYRFVDLKSGSMVAEGTVDTQKAVPLPASKKAYARCFALGQQIARVAMTNWPRKS